MNRICELICFEFKLANQLESNSDSFPYLGILRFKYERLFSLTSQSMNNFIQICKHKPI